MSDANNSTTLAKTSNETTVETSVSSSSTTSTVSGPRIVAHAGAKTAPSVSSPDPERKSKGPRIVSTPYSNALETPISDPKLAAQRKAQTYYDTAARILDLQERERVARAKEATLRQQQQRARDTASKEFDAAFQIIKLQQERLKQVENNNATARILRLQQLRTKDVFVRQAQGFGFTRLPHDVQMHILTLLPPDPIELCNVSLVCRDLKTLTFRNYLWHMLAIDQWGIVDRQQRPRKGETWQSYYVETFKMLHKSEETFVRVSVERGLTLVVKNELHRFQSDVIEHICSAIQHQQPTIVSILLPSAPKSSLGGSGRSPLRLAIRSNHLSLAKKLLKANADPHTPLSLPAIHYAAQHGATNTMLDLLLEQYRTPLEGVQMRAADGQTPLHHACAYGHTSTAALLLQSGALLEAVDSRNQTPLAVAVRSGSVPGVAFAMQQGATVNQSFNASGDGRTLLHTAASNGYARIVDLLVEHGADIEARDKLGNTPLAFAAFGGHEKTIRHLIRHDAKIDVCNADGLTPLHNATRSGNAEGVKLLLRLGARADAEDCDGRTASEYARTLGHTQVVRMIDSYLPASNGSAPSLLVSPRSSVRTIGLIGGTDWQATAKYFALLNKEMQARSLSKAIPPILVASCDWGEPETESTEPASSTVASPKLSPRSPTFEKRTKLSTLQHASSSPTVGSPLLSPRSLDDRRVRLRDAILLLAGSGAEVLCVAGGTTVNHTGLRDEDDVIATAVGREGRFFVGRWNSVALAAKQAKCKSAVFLSVDDNFDKVDAHSKLRDSNSRVSNAFAVHNILVGHVCVCAKERLLRVSSIEKKSDAKRLLSAILADLHQHFDCVLFMADNLYEIWTDPKIVFDENEFVDVFDDNEDFCNETDCCRRPSEKNNRKAKNVVLDSIHCHIVAICDAALLPSQLLSFQKIN